MTNYLGGKILSKTYHTTLTQNRESSYDSKALGTTIRLLRESLQLTQSDLGGLSSFSSAEISKLESGARKKIPMDSLIKIAPHLNVSLDYLLASCISAFTSDYERFYDFEGNEVDLYKIARNIYSVDSELLLLLASSDFLADQDSIKFIKSWIQVKSKINNASTNSSIFRKMFEDFKNYCISFLKTLSEFLINDESKNNSKYIPSKGES